MKKVFLGGTCVLNSKWREKLIPMLDKTKINYFNPVVKVWNDEARKREIYERENDDYVLYVISRPYSTYSIAEATDDSNKRPKQTIVCILNEKKDDGSYWMTKQENRHLNQVGLLCERNGAKYFTTLEQVAEYLNK